MKIMPMTTLNGTAALDLDHPKRRVALQRLGEDAPRVDGADGLSCTRTAHTRINHRFAPRPVISGPVSVLLTALPLPVVRRRVVASSGVAPQRAVVMESSTIRRTARLETLALRLDGVLGSMADTIPASKTPNRVHAEPAMRARPLRAAPTRVRPTATAPAAPTIVSALLALSRRAALPVRKAPDSLLASKVTGGQVVRTRPLCPYPQVARYRGQGSVDEASSFSCVAPPR